MSARRYADAVTVAWLDVWRALEENELLADLDAEDAQTEEHERLLATLDGPDVVRQ